MYSKIVVEVKLNILNSGTRIQVSNFPFHPDSVSGLLTKIPQAEGVTVRLTAERP